MERRDYLMCRIDGADDWDFYAGEVKRKARKEHKCGECRRTIARGESYTYAYGVMDKRSQTYHTCAHCKAAAEWLQVACGGWLFEGILEELQEHWDEEYELRSWTLARLIVGMRRKWKDGAMPVPELEAVRASVPEQARSYA